MTLIIDASIGVKWLVPEEHSGLAADLLREGDLQVPALFFSEVGNALIKKERRGEIDLASVSGPFADLHRLVSVVDEQSIMPKALDLALSLGHSFYDCVYLALAEKLDLTLATGDVKFATKLNGTKHQTRLRLLGAAS